MSLTSLLMKTTSPEQYARITNDLAKVVLKEAYTELSGKGDPDPDGVIALAHSLYERNARQYGHNAIQRADMNRAIQRVGDGS